jgi:serine/threonine-protein kinase RsbW
MSEPLNEATGAFSIRRLEEVGPVRRWLSAELDSHRYSPHDTFAVRTGFEEAVTNAITHGNSGDPAKAVSIELAVSETKAEITVADEGPGFNAAGLEDPTAEQNLLKESGRGVMLIRSFMDEVNYNDAGNRVRLVKYRSHSPHA